MLEDPSISFKPNFPSGEHEQRLGSLSFVGRRLLVTEL
jgi:hypothetical protein